MGTINLQNKKQTEFEALLSNQDLPFDSSQLSQILEQKITNVIDDVVDSIIDKSNAETSEIILKNIVSKIPSTILVQYSRAGRSYVSIEHTMGNLGNLLFSGIVKKSTSDDYHTITQQNKICFIFRQ